MKFLQKFKSKANAISSQFAIPTANEKNCNPEISQAEGLMEVFSSGHGMDVCTAYGIGQEAFETDLELESWPEEDLKTLFYEMSTESSEGLLET